MSFSADVLNVGSTYTQHEAKRGQSIACVCMGVYVLNLCIHSEVSVPVVAVLLVVVLLLLITAKPA